MLLLALVSTKGGCGKSTLSINLAVAAALNGSSVLLVDCDFQKSTLYWEGLRLATKPIVISLPSPKIHKVLPSLATRYDVVIIDSGGGRQDSTIMRSAIMACGKGVITQQGGIVLIPAQPSQIDLWGLSDTVEVIEDARAFADIECRVLLNQVCRGVTSLRKAQEAIESIESVPLLGSRLYSRVAYKHSAEQGLGVMEFDPHGKASIEVATLWRELMNINQNMITGGGK